MVVSDEDLLRGSEARLWSLIEQRAQPGADVAAIDARIWELFGEDWAVVFTDLAGFSRHTERFGILHFLQIIHEERKLLLPIVTEHCGFLVKSDADSFLLLFRSARSAVLCGIAMQRACAVYNQSRDEEEKVLLCLGIGCGRILRIGEADVWGAEVNAASKLGEDTARAGEVLATAAAVAAAGPLPGVAAVDLGHAVPGSARNFRLDWDASEATS
jgi:class 3 adenylate cyclase